MLILTHQPGERLRIGENVVVTVLGIKGNQVRIRIDAPRDIAVDREEIAERKRMVNTLAGIEGKRLTYRGPD